MKASRQKSIVERMVVICDENDHNKEIKLLRDKNYRIIQISNYVDKRKIELEDNIHQLGSYEVTVKLGTDTTPKIKVNVVEEQAQEGKEEEKETGKTESA